MNYYKNTMKPHGILLYKKQTAYIHTYIPIQSIVFANEILIY